MQAPYSRLTPWGWPDGLEHNSRIPLYKSFYEQVFYEVQQKSTRKPLKRWKCYIPNSRKAGVFKAPSRHSYKICCWRNFFPTSRLTQERRKIEYRWATYKKSIRFAIKFFVLRVAQFKRAMDFYTTSYLQGQRSVCPKPRISFFLFTSIGVQKQPVLVEVSAPMRLALQGSHVRRLYRKRTPLCSKSSTIKGLLYARLSSRCKAFVARNVSTIAWAKCKEAVIRQATNAMYGMGTLKIPLQRIRSEEGPHYPLGAKRVHEFRYPLVIPYPGCTV